MEKSNRICRTCLKSSPTMVPLFYDTSLCQKILAISSVVVSPGGNLPTVVCVECVINVNSAFNFRQVLINSDATLKTANIKNAKRRLCMKNTRDPVAVSSKDTENDPSQNQASIIKLEDEDSTSVTTLSIDFNPFREHSLGSSNLGPVETHPAPTSKESLNHESAVLPSNLTKFLDFTPKRSLSPVNLAAHIEEGCATIKTESNVALPETHQPARPVKISVINRRAKQSRILVKDILCQICGNLFNKSHFTRHFLNHIEDPVSCKVCGKTVKNIIKLPDHMKMHGPPVRTCKYCGRTFKHISNYVDHINVHTGNKRYKCGICVKSFTLSNVLKKHLLTHTGEKPYLCKYCKKCFTSRHALKTHIRQHTNERPYTCDHCSMGFHQKGSLTAHLKSKHSKVITA